jgi:hypothetical protein
VSGSDVADKLREAASKASAFTTSSPLAESCSGCFASLDYCAMTIAGD